MRRVVQELILYDDLKLKMVSVLVYRMKKVIKMSVHTAKKLKYTFRKASIHEKAWH